MPKANDPIKNSNIQAEIEIISKDLESNKNFMRKELGYSYDEFNLNETLKPSVNFVDEMMRLIDTRSNSEENVNKDSTLTDSLIEADSFPKPDEAQKEYCDTKKPFYLKHVKLTTFRNARSIDRFSQEKIKSRKKDGHQNLL